MSPSAPMLELARLWQTLQRYRFAMLLASLIMLFLAAAVAYLFQEERHRLITGIAIALLFDLMLLSAVNAVCQTRRTMTVALSVAVPAAIASFLTATIRSTSFLVASNLLSLAFVTLVIVLVLGFLFRSRLVDVNMICASLCVYLLMGIAWSSLYSLCEVLHPESFFYSYADESKKATMVFGGEKSLIPIYYSFVTLTTLGYGDIIPVSSPARILAVLEATIGQIYLTVLVARLVGLHIAYVTSPTQS